jgi:hypothetical protein
MRRMVALLVGSALALVLTAGATPAFADANPTASCLGIGGSGDKALRAEDAHETIDVFAPDAGTTPGGVYRVWAQEHLGSGEACFGGD